MPVQKLNKAESVRNQWAQQRRGEVQRSHSDAVPTATGGSHFAKPAAPSGTAPDPRAAAQEPRPASSRSGMADLMRASDTGMAQRVSASVAQERASRQPSAPTASYSRYNNRYRNNEPGSASSMPVGMMGDMAPAYDEEKRGLRSWLPYIVYGLVAVLASVVWCAVSRVTATGPLVPGSLAITVGLVVLCVIVLAGIALALVAAKLTADADGLSFVDAFAPAIGKTAVAMVLGVIVWVVSSAIVTL